MGSGGTRRLIGAIALCAGVSVAARTGEPAGGANAPTIDRLAAPAGTQSLAGAQRGRREQIGPTEPPCVIGSEVTGVDVPGRNLVTFTFDDGPTPRYTREIMQILEARGLTGTFFLVGNMIVDFPKVPAEIVTRGHEVANHSVTHSMVPKTLAAEIPIASDMIQFVTGVRPVYFRPPGVVRDPLVDEALVAEGLCSITTTVDLQDYELPRWTPSRLCARFAAKLHPGMIALLHDGLPDHQATVDALPCMLDVAEARGYTVVGLTALLTSGTQYSHPFPPDEVIA